MHLIILACLLAQPDRCEEFSVPTEARLPMECLSAMSEWAVTHPSRRVARFRCAAPETRA